MILIFHSHLKCFSKALECKISQSDLTVTDLSLCDGVSQYWKKIIIFSYNTRTIIVHNYCEICHVDCLIRYIYGAWEPNNQPHSQGPLSSSLKRGLWLQLVVCLCTRESRCGYVLYLILSSVQSNYISESYKLQVLF